MAGFGDYFNKTKDYVSFRQFLNAVSNGDSGYAVSYLNRKPADLDRTEAMTGRNALMCAITVSAASTVKLLLEKGASLKGQDKDGYNVLHMAVLCAPKQITDMLLQKPDITAIINEKNRHNGVTPLMYACMIPEDTALVQSLLDKGADAAAKDFKGRTALDIAKANGCTKTAALLEQWRPRPKRPVIRRTKPTKRKFDF